MEWFLWTFTLLVRSLLLDSDFLDTPLLLGWLSFTPFTGPLQMAFLSTVMANCVGTDSTFSYDMPLLAATKTGKSFRLHTINWLLSVPSLEVFHLLRGSFIPLG